MDDYPLVWVLPDYREGWRCKVIGRDKDNGTVVFEFTTGDRCIASYACVEKYHKHP